MYVHVALVVDVPVVVGEELSETLFPPTATPTAIAIISAAVTRAAIA